MANLSDFLSGGGGTLGELDDVSLRAAIFNQERLTFDDFSDAWINDYGELIVRTLPSGDLRRIDVDDDGSIRTPTTLIQRAIRANLVDDNGGGSLPNVADIGDTITFRQNLSDDDLARVTGWELLCMADAIAQANGSPAVRTVTEGTVTDGPPPVVLPGTFPFMETNFGTYNYRLTLLSEDGAHSITEHQVRYFAPAVVSFTPPVFAEGNTEVTLGTSVSDPDNPGPVTYVWTKDGSVIAGETGPTLMITNDASNSGNGVYTVTVTDGDGRSTSATETIMLNGPLAGSLAHRGSQLINDSSELVATLSDADGPANIGAWSITRATGGTPDPANPLFNGTGALDGVTAGSGVFSVMNTGNENVDDVYTLQATDTAATPHTITETATVDLINMTTVSITYNLAGSGAGRSLSNASDSFTGIPGQPWSGSTTVSLASGNVFSGNGTCSATNGYSCSYNNTNRTATVSGVFPLTNQSTVVTVTQNSIVDLPDLTVSRSGDTYTVSESGFNYTYTTNCPGGTNENGFEAGNSESTNPGRDPACDTTCSFTFTASKAGFDNGSAGGTRRGDRPSVTLSCSLETTGFQIGNRGNISNIRIFSRPNVTATSCAGGVPSGWTAGVAVFYDYSCSNGNSGTSSAQGGTCAQTGGATSTSGTVPAASTEAGVTGDALSGNRC